MLMLAGLELYPGAIGFLNYDTYVLGYDGYLCYRCCSPPFSATRSTGDMSFIALVLNIGVLGFLLSAGRSLNLWDYVIDPVAWFLAIG